jgi:hypothetical protein
MKMRVTSFAVLGMVAASVLSSGSPQNAAQDQLPTGTLYSAEELSRNFVMHQFTPYGNPKFSLEILIPKGWESHLSDFEPQQISHDTDAPVPMIEFYPSGADDLGVNVQYMRVPGEKPVSAFMEEYVKRVNGTVAVHQQFNLQGRTVEDLLIKTNDDSLGPLVNRVMAFRRGDIVFISTAWGVEENYEKYKKVFAASLLSFNPTGK